jgi:Protein of unknown function (DUF3071)
MRQLRLVGLSADAREVLFVDDDGTEYTTPADDRLRAALRGDRARLGQLEIEMDSVLRPRDIQARIRAGDSPDVVAAMAQVPVEKIMPFCLPVLAEREHIAELARRSHVRRKNTDGPARRLSDLVAERLRSRNVDPDAAVWDAWRRDDGRWTVQAAYNSGERQRSAQFVFDAMGRYCTADDDEARWLTGERQATRKGPQPREPLPGERRLSSVPPDGGQLSLTDAEEDTSDDLTAVVRAVHEQEADADDADAVPSRPAGEVPELSQAPTSDVDPEEDAGRLSEPAGAQPASGTGPAPVAGVDADDAAEVGDIGDGPAPQSAEPATEATAGSRKRRRRPSMPSWDEIMFGKGKED